MCRRQVDAGLTLCGLRCNLTFFCAVVALPLGTLARTTISCIAARGRRIYTRPLPEVHQAGRYNDCPDEVAMVIASQLRPGTVLKIGADIFKVFEASYHIGQGKMPGSVHARGRHVLSGTLKEFRFRPEERLEDTQLQRQEMEFLYA